ncbi:MAG: ABC transporter permease, partial [Proteobacteria bacterium]|nr:ABC transporter permease [Pseudomonadota bacterium]
MAFLRRFGRNPGALLGAVFLILVVLMTIAAPLLAPGDPMATVGQPLKPPGPEFPFGTDMLGRNVLAGVIH